jgi:FkbM family methyltransferase
MPTNTMTKVSVNPKWKRALSFGVRAVLELSQFLPSKAEIGIREKAGAILAHRGLRYISADQFMLAIMQQVLKNNSCCVDVGAHSGAVLNQMLRMAPNAQHFAFEPLASCCARLEHKYRNRKVVITNAAVGASNGEATFYCEPTHLESSSLARRTVDNAVSQSRAVEVQVVTLDYALGNKKVDFIKIDVEGAELAVLQGAKELIARSQCPIFFEHEISGASAFGYGPKEVYNYLQSIHYSVFLPQDWLEGKPCLSEEGLCNAFNRQLSSYYIALPKLS